MTTHLPRHLRQPDAIAGAAAGRPRTFVPTDALRLALNPPKLRISLKKYGSNAIKSLT